LPGDVERALVSLGVLTAGVPWRAQALGGGVSSDIWRLESGGRTVCVKRALAQLRVADEWHAPVGRNATEVAWFQAAARIVPAAVPAVLAHDPAAGVFVMEYLDPARYPLWKPMLRDGIARTVDATAMAGTLGRLHAATAGDAAMARRFATDAEFHALRLEPYLLATAARHPDRADALRALVEACTTNRRALVHGDVSPKNILIGPRGPVFLDAETAWYGDPAFDVAFCLNHLLLKCLWNPAAREDLLRCFDAFRDTYLRAVDWEPASALESRAAALLPGLLLARVDGKSPVEYLEPAGRELVRRAGRDMLADAPRTLGELASRWRVALQRSTSPGAQSA
jgi:aminoglycoside phosphotransferase (APT) family kinase protein